MYLLFPDENHLKYVHAAKCLNTKCNNPVNITWRENLVLVKKPETKVENKIENGVSEEKDGDNQVHSKSEKSKEIGNVEKFERKTEIPVDNGVSEKTNIEEVRLNGEEFKLNGEPPNKSICCEECGTEYPEKHVEVFVKTMEFSELHLQNMKETSVSCILFYIANLPNPMTRLSFSFLDVFCSFINHSFSSFIH